MKRSSLAATIAAALVASCAGEAFRLFDPAAPVLDEVYALESIDGSAPPVAFPDTVSPLVLILAGDTLVFAPDGQVARRRAQIFVLPLPGGGLDSTAGTVVRTGAYEVIGNQVVLWIQERAPIALPDTLDAVGADRLEFDDPLFGARLRYRRAP